MILVHLATKVVVENRNYDIGHHHILIVILCHTSKPLCVCVQHWDIIILQIAFLTNKARHAWFEAF